MPLTGRSLAKALIEVMRGSRHASEPYVDEGDNGRTILDGCWDMDAVCDEALKALQRSRAEGDLIPPALRVAAAGLLIPTLPAEASAFAEQALEAAWVGPEGMKMDQTTIGMSTVERVVRVREMLYDFAKEHEPKGG